jgi:glycosyltransferase involved in cell wall biosynthesis
VKVPKISVIVPVYNCEQYIGRCIRSLMAQSLPKEDYEIIVINDCSTDRTRFALDLFKEEIKVITHPEQMGLPAALNSGIKNAHGQYMIRLDSDDYVHREYLNILYLYLTLNADIDAVACDYLEVNDHEEVLRKVNCMSEPIGCGIMFRMEQLIEVGLYDENMILHEEKDLRHRFEERFKVHRVQLPLYRYRRHEKNITNDDSKMKAYYEKLNTKHSKNFCPTV